MLLWAFKATKMSAIVSLEKESSSQIFSFKPHFWKFYAKQDRPHIHILKKIQSENTRKLIYVNISLWFIHFYLFKKELFKKWKKRFDCHAFILTICISFSGLCDRGTQSEWLETTEIFVSWVWRPEIWNWVWAGPCSQEGSGQCPPCLVQLRAPGVTHNLSPSPACRQATLWVTGPSPHVFTSLSFVLVCLHVQFPPFCKDTSHPGLEPAPRSSF